MAVSVTSGEYTVTAEHGTALSLLYLREMIADSSMWKALVAQPLAMWSDAKDLADEDTSDRDDALAAILFDRVAEGSDDFAAGEEPARCIIRPWDEWVSEFAATSSWDVSGLFLMSFEIPEPLEFRGEVQDKIGAATIDNWNKLERIVEEIQTQATSPDSPGERLVSVEIRRVILPGLIDPRENKERYIRTASYALRNMGASG